MQKFINLFLTLVLPITILFILIASVYFSMDFEINKATKLGILAGVLSGTGVSVLMALILLFMRKIRHSTQRKRKTPRKKEIRNTNNRQSLEKISHSATKPVDQKFLLLMDKDLAFEVALHAVMDQNIGEFSDTDKNQRTIIVHTTHETITLSITSVTKHTSEVLITAIPQSKNVQNIISYIKEKEFSFLEY